MIAPKDPCLLVFTHLCNPLLLSVHKICALLLTSRIYKVSGCHYHD